MDSIILLIAFFGFIYFIMIRPQQKQQQKRREMLNNLQLEDKIVTIGGIHGVIKALREDNLQLEIAENLEITVLKTAVGHVIDDEDEDDDDLLEDDDLLDEEATEE